MNTPDFFKSIGDEIQAIKNRMQSLIEDRHWLTVGEYKESVVRTILRRHIPKNIGVGRGFVVGNRETSTQIDILLYDLNKPVLFSDGDLVVVTPDCVRGVFEVKTCIEVGAVAEIVDKLHKIMLMIKGRPFEIEPVFGIISLESSGEMVHVRIKEQLNIWRKDTLDQIDLLAIGPDRLYKFWEFDPGDSGRLLNKWHEYRMDNLAWSYFIVNVIAMVSGIRPTDESLWFPESGKEGMRVAVFGDIP